jgi:Ca2+-binding EF-hand superfamily protein
LSSIHGTFAERTDMTTDIQDRKLERAYGQLDIDGNGYVERDDIVGLGARLLVGFGESPTSTKGRSIIDRFDALWTTLAAQLDADHDGRILVDEYRQAMTAAFIEGTEFDRVFRPAAMAISELCDVDGDGVVSAEEFGVAQNAFGTSADDAAAAFGKLDTNGSGTLTVDELVEAARDFYTSDDPDAAGNWLFGPL